MRFRAIPSNLEKQTVQFQVVFRGKKKTEEFYFPNDKPARAWQAYLDDKTKHKFEGNENGVSVAFDFNDVLMLAGIPDFEERVTVART
jgi:hypothetical protein